MFCPGDKNSMGCFVRVTKTAWDVWSVVAEMVWDVMSGVTKQHGMFCPGWQIFVGCFVKGVKKWHGIFCPAPREYTRRYTFFINFLFLLKSRSDS